MAGGVWVRIARDTRCMQPGLVRSNLYLPSCTSSGALETLGIPAGCLLYLAEWRRFEIVFRCVSI